ncbi:MAG TPA: response regulator [Candidatus Binatia bacterium]|jgi:CheY-like chemotaxis protein|nr:response regulator [Candidatus Binatia bacterium]
MARILVAEDDLLVADTVQTMLRSGGYEVILVRNGDEAVRMFREQDFDLVLCDVHMPGKDGLEATEEIRRLSPGVPIVSMTGSYPRHTGGAHLDPAFLNATKRVGATRVLAKPFRAHELLAIVRGCLGA